MALVSHFALVTIVQADVLRLLLEESKMESVALVVGTSVASLVVCKHIACKPTTRRPGPDSQLHPLPSKIGAQFMSVKFS